MINHYQVFNYYSNLIIYYLNYKIDFIISINPIKSLLFILISLYIIKKITDYYITLIINKSLDDIEYYFDKKYNHNNYDELNYSFPLKRNRTYYDNSNNSIYNKTLKKKYTY
jgi:hypothetical protein|tara:strand:+ start:4136 stop:4471 length:336 start_codon:yes stop_codon:yes gene_type:complete